SQLIGDASPALSKLLSVAAWRLNPSSAARRAMLAAAARPGIAVLTATDAVDSVAFSPHGETLAAGSADGTVLLWNAATQNAIGSRLINGHSNINSVAFSPDSKTLAVASTDGSVRLWDV